jgi:uncharacterized protein (DUF1800 family)
MADTSEPAAIALTRFGLGARPGEIAEIGGDAKGWLKRQIRRAGADQPESRAGPLPSLRDGFAALAQYRMQARQGSSSDADPQATRRAALAPLQQGLVEESLARTQLAALTDAGFRERWTLFWSNHFTVAAKGIQLVPAVGPFEREAIRPNVFGAFRALLGAAVSHPGMLLYLDQAQSIGPASPVGRRAGRGLNENLAREILELHTVGADAGYTQADVTEFARALTGRSVGGPNVEGDRQGAYFYRAAIHEPGERRVMGRSYRAAQDDQAEAILDDLAAHLATARRLCRKIAAHFVADDPPASLVERLTTAWTASHGDLGRVADALVDAPEAWATRAAKFKTPYEFLVSAYRAAGAAPALGPREVVQPLTALGQRPFAAPQPNGWSDLATDWAAPDALVKRLAWARLFAARYAPAADPAVVADEVLGPRLSPRVRTAVTRAESRQEAFALLLMSPEFQRR